MRERIGLLWARLLCRLTDHPGVVWHNVGGLGPDMHCARYGADLG